ncbi:MAG: DUF2806 domain-containing protein [Chloroflexi bacterium]|nr:DUF2806 domain-containing protein [Chloroflexota bacterium]
MVGELIAGTAAGLTKPATVLIERVSDAVGGIAKPWQIQRVAKANAKANLIVAQSEIEITELQQRAAHRFIEEETKNQINIESITHQAIPHLSEDAEPEKIDDDFLRNFFDKSRLVSDEQMQDIWARILAGEANNPGTFSRKTINILADMDKSDADLFTRLCCYIWVFPGGAEPLVFVQDDFFTKRGVYLSSLAEIASLGLLHTSNLGFSLQGLPSKVTVSYFGRRVELSLAEGSNGTISCGDIVLTGAGRQIASITRLSPVHGLFEFMCEKWEKDSNIESVRVLS